MASRSVFAVTGNRVVAIGLDLFLLAWAGSFVVAEPPLGNLAVPLIALLYFALMPATRLQGTLGKYVLRIKLADRSGGRLGWRASIIRGTAMLAWLAIPFLLEAWARHSTGLRWLTEYWWLLFFLPWMTLAFRVRRESAFDLLAGSVVTARRATPEATLADAGREAPSRVTGAAVVLLCFMAGYGMLLTAQVMHVKNFRARTSYAIQAVQDLKARVVDFRAVHERWPSSQDLGVPDWNPYPDGGGYRLKQDGSIEIEFTVLPELKGHRIVFVPRLAPGGQSVTWACSTDGGINPQYLPVNCR